MAKEANAVGGSISEGINNNSVKAEKAMQFSISETGSIKDFIASFKEEVLDSEDKLRRMIMDNEENFKKYGKE